MEQSSKGYDVRSTVRNASLPLVQIPKMLGVVLSSSKYGVRQARGKYGMGAKMALIWSKKSTGLPIQVCARPANQIVSRRSGR